MEIPITRKDEIGKLMRSFIKMVENLKIAEKNLIEKQKTDHEIAIAQRIQNALFPKVLPKYPEIEIATFYDFAKEVGGDYYDVIPLNNSLALIVADVSGKGIPAALIMAMFRSTLRTEIKIDANPVTLAKRLNSVIIQDIEPGQFITFLYGLLERNNMRLSFVNAGHLPLIRLR